MNSTETLEEILLYTPEEVSQTLDETALNNITDDIAQTNKWKRWHKSFHIYDNRFLGIDDYRSNSHKKFWISLIHLDPSPVRDKNNAFLGYLAALLMLFLGIFLSAHKSLDLLMNMNIPYQLSIASLLITVAIIVLLISIYRKNNELVFYTTSGKIPIFSMTYNFPTKKEFTQFIKNLNRSIQTANSNNFYNLSEKLAAELSEHRRLKNEGIISTQLYDQAKSNIMKCH